VTAFSFAVQATPAKIGDDWAALAQRAEQLGYRALLLPDHVGSGGPITAMAFAGAVTTTLRVGTLMMAIDFRNPVTMSEELVTLDRLTSGRTEIGLGAGWMVRDYERAGVPMLSSEERIDKLEEVVGLVRDLWAHRRIEHESARFVLRGPQVGPTPSRPSPLIVLGGGSPRMLRLAARTADIVSVSASMSVGRATAPLGSSALFASFERRVAAIGATAADAGRTPEIQCLAFTTRVTDRAREYVEAYVCESFGLPADDVMRSPLALVGTVDEIAEKIATCRERLGISYWVMKADAMDDLAPVIAALSGS
jgi:probable F420-dependent oxidoreductase